MDVLFSKVIQLGKLLHHSLLLIVKHEDNLIHYLYQISTFAFVEVIMMDDGKISYF